jgi:hypothetical protein
MEDTVELNISGHRKDQQIIFAASRFISRAK